MRVLEEGLTAAALAVRATAGALYVGQKVESLRCVATFGPEGKLLLERGTAGDPGLAKRALGRRTPFVAKSLVSDPQISERSQQQTRVASP